MCLTKKERKMAEAAVEATEAAQIRSELGNDFRAPESESITLELLMKLGIVTRYGPRAPIPIRKDKNKKWTPDNCMLVNNGQSVIVADELTSEQKLAGLSALGMIDTVIRVMCQRIIDNSNSDNGSSPRTAVSHLLTGGFRPALYRHP
jgi:hypothetical protein